MYTLPTGRIVNSLKDRTVARPESRPVPATSVPVIEPAQHADPQQAAEAAHRMSFRW
jgi:hypothetical protein